MQSIACEDSSLKLLSSETFVSYSSLITVVVIVDDVCVIVSGYEADSPHKSTDCHPSLLPYQRTFSRHFHNFVEVCLLSEPISRYRNSI